MQSDAHKKKHVKENGVSDMLQIAVGVLMEKIVGSKEKKIKRNWNSLQGNKRDVIIEPKMWACR